MRAGQLIFLAAILMGCSSSPGNPQADGGGGVRFTSVVPIDSRVRLRMKVKAARETSKGTLIERECVFELEGSERPALVCDWLALMLA